MTHTQEKASAPPREERARSLDAALGEREQHRSRPSDGSENALNEAIRKLRARVNFCLGAGWGREESAP